VRQQIVQIDVEPLNIGWTYPVDHAIVGDARTQLAALVESFGALEPVERSEGAAERVADAIAASPPLGGGTASGGDVDGTQPILPPDSIGLLADTVPDDTIVTCDAGENRLFMMQWFRVPSRGEYLQPAAGGGMGYAIPAALGARLAHPGRPVVAVCGDGGFGMSLHSLMTAVQEQLPITVVVLNNGALGWVAHGMGERAVASHFAPFDHAAIATAIGCEGIHVRDTAELERALRRIPDIEVPFVIDVPTSMAISFKDVMSTFSSTTRRESGY
jgi:acetolactate synthase I/II/III large subunit